MVIHLKGLVKINAGYIGNTMYACLIMLSMQATLSVAKPTTYAVGSIPSSANAIRPLDGFVSYSIEFSSFPDFAGNKSNPNDFSNNLLDNLKAFSGIKPYIRIGGNTQDFAIFNPELPFALNGTYNLSRSADYPTTIEIGPSYFESYGAWPHVRFSHGFNLGGNRDARRWETLLQTVPLACEALGRDRLYLWEYGNEPDLFVPAVRTADYDEEDYVAEWLNGTRAIRRVLESKCPDLLGNDTYGFLAPSFAGTTNHLKQPRTWADGINADGDIKLFSSHNYISGAETPGVTLQGTLMNHTRTALSVGVHAAENAAIRPGVPYVLGETNSLYHQGRPGLSDSFGAALWALDFALQCAAVGIGRVHFHMGTNYRYASWQPIPTNKTSIGTKPPYYGNVAASTFLGPPGTLIASVPLSSSSSSADLDPDTDVAYAAYAAATGALSRLLVLNLRAYNHTLHGTEPNPAARPARRYRFAGPGLGLDAAATGERAGGVVVRRLRANGSDAITGITWDGWSYEYELDRGRPVRLGNVTVGERVGVVDGVVEVSVSDSEAVVLDFEAERGEGEGE
ncbi:glycoside hydrolase family 79 protein [Daldinia caldariorum]|uniref:glycoside hydrolase family 79 protein n=1 Tax=Daldinia caldariorum TaxID=326644 RepID=UPI002007E286|nr:glycoside hydrolase family 79 protein [Daldinia caldariorum]KAI1464112.1 glycoside hydrolase family 79 protein [Daldinia caldariorum]